MTQGRDRPGRRWPYVLLGLASSAVFMGVAVWRLRADAVWAALGTARLLPWLPVAVALYLVGQVLRGVRCRLLVSPEARLNTFTATNVVVLGYAVNNILPARLGELARAGMLAQRSGLPFAQSLSVTVLERVLDGLVMLGLLAFTYALLPVGGWVAATLELGAIVFGIALAVTLLAVLAPDFLLRAAGRLANPLGARAHDRVLSLTSQIVRGVQYLRRPAAALTIAAWSVLVWLVEAGMFLCLLPAFGLPADPLVALLAMTITNLGILLPSSPGFIGPFHFFCMKALVAVGTSEVVGFSYAVLVHLSFYLPVTAWGLAIIVGYGVRLGTTLERERRVPVLVLPDIKDLAAAAPLVQPVNTRRLDRALVEALLPLEQDGVAESRRSYVVGTVAKSVRGQLDALPLRFGLLLTGGLLVFRLATRLRFVRSYCALPLGKRRQWTERWTYGSTSLARQLFRAIRATALVAYYELPEERAEAAAGRSDVAGTVGDGEP